MVQSADMILMHSLGSFTSLTLKQLHIDAHSGLFPLDALGNL